MKNIFKKSLTYISTNLHIIIINDWLQIFRKQNNQLFHFIHIYIEKIVVIYKFEIIILGIGFKLYYSIKRKDNKNKEKIDISPKNLEKSTAASEKITEKINLEKEEKPKSIEKKDYAYRITSPLNFETDPNIEQGTSILVDEIPEWAENNPKIVIVKEYNVE